MNNTDKSLAMVSETGQPPAVVPSVNELEAYSKMAKFLFESGLYPEINNPAKAVVLMMTAQSMGLHPMDAIRGIDIIKGRPALKPQFLGALIVRAGHPLYDVTERSATACKILFYRRDKPQKSTEVSFTIEEAKTAGLTGREGAWKTFTADMLFNRCLARGARQCYPEIFFNTYIPEELQNEPAPNAANAPMRVIGGGTVDVVTGEVMETKASKLPVPTKPGALENDNPTERERINAAIRGLTGQETYNKRAGWLALTQNQFAIAAEVLAGLDMEEIKRKLDINSFADAVKTMFPDVKGAALQYSAGLHYIWHSLVEPKVIVMPESDPANAMENETEPEEAPLF